MPLMMDLQVRDAIGQVLAETAVVEPPPAGDWRTRRIKTEQDSAMVVQTLLPSTGISVDELSLTTDDGTELRMFWYRRDDTEQPGSAALYLHGGGMIIPWLPVHDALVRAYVAASGVPMLAVDYRVAPEHPDPVPVEDCYAALVWLSQHATELGIDPARIAVMGDSAGGGLSAGVAMLARDLGGPALAQQLLIFPMLDDRTVEANPQLLPFLTWTYDDNVTGWEALLGDRVGGPYVSPYAAPARAQHLAGLPATYIDVGGLDIFRDEGLVFARRLAEAGVPVEFHLHPGCPHLFEVFAPNADVSQRAVGDRIRRLRTL
jgi:acetyl esterase/lipase